MNFQQLKFVRETVRLDFNLTEVAKVVHVTQPGVSRQIKELVPAAGVGLHVEGLSKSYGMRQVLNQLHLHIANGEFVALVGRSGCGKKHAAALDRWP